MSARMSRPRSARRLLRRLGLPLAAMTALAGCADRLDHLGRAPGMSPVSGAKHEIDPTLPPTPIERRNSPVHPELAHGAATLVGPGLVGEMPSALTAAHRAAMLEAAMAHDEMATGSIPGAIALDPAAQASLWASGPTSLFGDRRARGLGDILTVLIEIEDSATLNNSTTRTRSGEDTVAAATVFGLEQLVDRIIPGDAVGLENGVTASGDSSSSGVGAITRDESISLRVAATVVDVLPNGHLVVTGNQEVRVNFELRDLQVAGIIRPEDITRQNTITYDKMANARISYGGRGQITDLQQPRVGQQIIDLISPF